MGISSWRRDGTANTIATGSGSCGRRGTARSGCCRRGGADYGEGASPCHVSP
ncbi:hypothetical protein U6Q43_06165 [Cutibacterium acnes]